MAGMAIATIVDAKRGILARVQIRSFQPTDRPNCEHLNMSVGSVKLGCPGTQHPENNPRAVTATPFPTASYRMVMFV